MAASRLQAALNGAWVVFLVAPLASVASLGGVFSNTLDLLTHLAPFWLAGSLGALVLALLPAAPLRRAALAGFGALGIAAAAILVIPEFTRAIRPPVTWGGTCQVKLIAFNVWEHNGRPGDAAAWLAAQAPDFILMADVEPPIRAALIHRGFWYDRGVGHTAIFSRSPAVAAPFKIPERDWPLLPKFARGTYSSACGPFSLVAVHLARPFEATRGAGSLAAELDRYDRERLIVAGDFNLTPWSFALRRLDWRLGLERRDRALSSWPAMGAPAPFLPIDHVYAGRAWRTVRVEQGPSFGSTHYPLIAVLALEPKGRLRGA
jgi:endonuclease/exonuclease/phosphatase (EEP) superfamily protein YafD